MTVLLAYYLIAGCLATAIFFYRVRPQLLLSAWCVAFGFFYAEFTGFLVFYERPAWVLRLAVAAVGASLLGLLLSFCISSYQWQLSVSFN
jgi:hypothetical protein